MPALAYRAKNVYTISQLFVIYPQRSIHMIERNDLFHLSFYKKKPFTGSCLGMRYYLTKAKESDAEDAADVLRAIVYPEPYNFEHTPEDAKTHQDFPFTEEGLDDACQWLNEQYTSRQEEWKHAPEF
jgi:beta-glucosidase/6-phospho-beta-glucosidase/beta-galactosidase